MSKTKCLCFALVVAAALLASAAADATMAYAPVSGHPETKGSQNFTPTQNAICFSSNGLNEYWDTPLINTNSSATDHTVSAGQYAVWVTGTNYGSKLVTLYSDGSLAYATTGYTQNGSIGSITLPQYGTAYIQSHMGNVNGPDCIYTFFFTP